MVSLDEVCVLRDEQNGDSPALQILLVANVGVHRQQKIERLFRRRQPTPIVQVGPSHAVSTYDFVSRQQAANRQRSAVVEKNPHAGAGSCCCAAD